MLDAKAELDPAIPKLLATLVHHSCAVNVARFAHKSNLLASGSDDTHVCILQLQPGPSSATFGSTDSPNIENWKQTFILRGHTMNVSDLNWSPTDTFLASSSMDNLVCIWETASGRKVHELHGHESFVKGVAWDPVGKYLASQGDDAVCIWRCEDWTQVRGLDLGSCTDFMYWYTLCIGLVYCLYALVHLVCQVCLCPYAYVLVCLICQVYVLTFCTGAIYVLSLCTGALYVLS
jgi:WD40 repeat protein